MVFVNGSWENVRTAEEAVALVRESMGSEFANRLEDLFNEKASEATPTLRNKIETALATIDDAVTELEGVL